MRIKRKELAFAHGEQLEVVYTRKPQCPPLHGWEVPQTHAAVALSLVCNKRVIKSEAMQSVWAFLNTATFHHIPYPSQGMSWLELFCIFELLGGRVDTHYGLAGQSRWSLKKCLVQFKHLVKHIVATCMPKEFHYFFRTCTNPNPRLCTFAISNFLSCIQCIYIPSVICKDEYLLALCSLRSKCNTMTRRRALLQGNVLLRPYKIRFRAIPSWRNITCLRKHHMIIPHYIQNSAHFSLQSVATHD